VLCKRFSLAAALAAASVLVLPGCAAGGQAARSGAVSPAYPFDAGALTVSAAENFYGDLLHALGGSRLKVYSFISDPNADPHQFEAAPGNARAVADSRLVIVNGLGYDAFMDRLLRASPSASRRVIDVQQLVGAQAGADPHLWYDPATMPRVAAAAAGALAAIDPAGAPAYRANLSAYLLALKPIADQVEALRPRTQGVAVAFTEPVYGYMAQALGLDVRSPEAFTRAVEEGNDPPPGAVAAERDLIARHEVKVLIYNSQAVTRVTSQIKDLARQSGVPVVGVTETQPPGQSFPQWQLGQLAALAAALPA
jgi:zinc/manganese transport system substrate-binding protein